MWRGTRDHNRSSQSSSWLDFVQTLFFGVHAWYIIGFFLLLSVFCLHSVSLIYIFYVTSRTLRKVRTSWSESTVIHIKVINHPDHMDPLCVSLRLRQMKDCSRERAQSDRKKETSRWHELSEWSVGGDVRWAHDLKQDKCHSKLEDPYNKSNSIYIQLRHTAGASGLKTSVYRKKETEKVR